MEAVGVWDTEVLAFQRVVVALSDHVPTAPFTCGARRLSSIEVLLSRLAESVLVVVRDAVVGTDADADKNAQDAVRDNVIDGDCDDESVTVRTGSLLLLDMAREEDIDSVLLRSREEEVDNEIVAAPTLIDIVFAVVSLAALKDVLTDVDPVCVYCHEAEAANVIVGLCVDDDVHRNEALELRVGVCVTSHVLPWYAARQRHVHSGRLPTTRAARPLQSAALVHALETSHLAPIHSGGHVHEHDGRTPDHDVACPLQSAAIVHTLDVSQAVPIHSAGHVHLQAGRLPLTCVALPLQSAASVQTFDDWHVEPVHSG
jgi:hypothetical protein